MDPGRGAALLPGVAFPGVVAELAGAGRAPEVPEHVAVGGVQRQRRAAVAVVGADEQLAVVVDDRDLLDVAEAVVLRVSQTTCAGVLVRAPRRSCRPTSV